MTGDILSQIGLGDLDTGMLILILAGLVLIMMILMIVFIVKEEKLKKRYNRFMKGKDAKSLEKEIVGLYDNNEELRALAKENQKDIEILYKKFTKAVQKVGIVKYDAYQQMGGLLSFSLALLDENNDGFILNSVHSTEGCYTYTKEIRKGESKLELGNEERVALQQAMNM